jgi:hypothetical protein
MTDLTPTPKQLQSWIDKICYPHEQGVGPSLKDKELASLAFKAGADQELEACCVEMKSLPSPLGIPFGAMASNALRAARRPKPPTLKEQALATLEVEPEDDKELIVFDTDQVNIIRKALEPLPDD